MRKNLQRGLALLLCVSLLALCGCQSSSKEGSGSGMLSICFFKATAGVSKTINDLPDLIEVIKFRSMYGDNAFSIKDEAGNTILTGKDVSKKVEVCVDPSDSSLCVINISFNEEGTKKFEEATRKAVENNNAPLMICIADEVISSPRVQSVITDGNVMINGLDYEEARDLANRINTALPPQE